MRYWTLLSQFLQHIYGQGMRFVLLAPRLDLERRHRLLFSFSRRRLSWSVWRVKVVLGVGVQSQCHHVLGAAGHRRGHLATRFILPDK